MRSTLLILVCGFVLTPIIAGKEVLAAEKESRRPNILIILTDDKY